MADMMRAVGLMSGTSIDGIDVALIETDGEATVRRGPSRTFAYDAKTRAAVAEAIALARPITKREERPGSMGRVERDLTELNAQAVTTFLEEAGLPLSSIDVVGFHGQTVLHRPEEGLTVQLGDGPLLSRLLGAPVVYDLRSADVANGGQGHRWFRSITGRWRRSFHCVRSASSISVGLQISPGSGATVSSSHSTRALGARLSMTG